MQLDAMRSMSTLPWIHDDLHLHFEQAGPGAGQTPEQYPTGVIAILKAIGDPSDLQVEPFSLVPHYQGDKGPMYHFTLTPQPHSPLGSDVGPYISSLRMRCSFLTIPTTDISNGPSV